jgi:VWFA-related protein
MRRGAWFCVQAVVFCLMLLVGSKDSYAQRGGMSRPNMSSNKSPYTIPVTVRRVVLDVVVTDNHGNPIQGLKKKDFSVYEEKKSQEIRSFEEVTYNPGTNFAAPKIPAMPPDTYLNVATAPESGPLNVIVYDAVHMEGADPMSSTGATDQIVARKQLEAFLANKPDGTRFSLFLLAKDFRLLQGFTTDKSKLLEAFDLHRKDGSIPQNFLYGDNYGKADTDLPFYVMTFLGHYLEGLPGRKNLIWLSSNFPSEVPLFGIQALVVGNVMAPSSSSPLQAQGFDGAAPTTMGETWDFKVMKQAIDALNAAQVSVYPVNVSGLKPELNGIDTIADHIANATGGRAYYNTNDITRAITDATVNGANYYEITYSPSDAKEDGTIRRIRVNLNRKDCLLEYRRYYFAEDPNAPLTNDEKRDALAVADQVVAHKEGDSLYAYMQHGAPLDHDIVFRAQFHEGPEAMATPDQMANLVEQPAYFVVRRRDKTVKLPPPVPLRAYKIDYLVLDQSAEAHASGQVLEFAAGAYNSNGKLLNGIAQNAMRGDAQSGKGTGQPAFFRAEQTLEVPAGAAWLRVAVRDVNTDRIGTMEIPLPLAADRQVATGHTVPAAASALTNPNQ